MKRKEAQPGKEKHSRAKDRACQKAGRSKQKQQTVLKTKRRKGKHIPEKGGGEKHRPGQGRRKTQAVSKRRAKGKNRSRRTRRGTKIKYKTEAKEEEDK